MSNSLSDKIHLKSFFYGDTSKLEKRLDIWIKLGTNKITFSDWIINTIPINSNSRNILDVGCGTGLLLQKIAEKFPKIKLNGIDLSSKMVDLAKNKLKKANLILADAEELNFRNKVFDVVTCTHVLYHVPNQKKALQEMVRVTKDKGVIFITTSDNDLESGLNKIHYETLAKLGFPKKMQDKLSYLRFTPGKAIELMNDLNLKWETFTYLNDVHFFKLKDALEYYKSAMMFRQSFGSNDPLIAESKWLELYNSVAGKIESEISKDGYLEMRGKVVGFKIRL